ncbi:MAG: helix-turn-helix transcriptional regulator [Magnetovibrio sp.]|nr:helix-turn-helix transcriptional regulator [Magnetovibrio sp.]
MAEEASELLGELANTERLMIIALLHELGEMHVNEMVETLGANRASLSRHLGRLRDQLMVTTRRKHNRIYYALNLPKAAGLIKIIGTLMAPKGREINDSKAE